MTLSGVYVEHSQEHAACQLRAVILSFNKWRAARPSLFAFAVTGEWQLYGTSMFISLLSPFLKPVLMLYLYSHHNGTTVALSNLGPLLSMCGASYWSSGAIIPSVCLPDVGGENKAPPEHLRTVWTYEPERTDVLTVGPVFIFSYSSKEREKYHKNIEKYHIFKTVSQINCDITGGQTGAKIRNYFATLSVSSSINPWFNVWSLMMSSSSVDQEDIYR